MRPFILQFGQPLSPDRGYAVRYDSSRQVSQVLLNDKWVDAVNAPDRCGRATRETEVRAETTDDA
jgi:hypothetical protein